MQGTVILHLYNEKHGVIYEASQPLATESVDSPHPEAPAVAIPVSFPTFELPKVNLADYFPSITVSIPTVDWKKLLTRVSLALFVIGLSLVLIYAVPTVLVKAQDWVVNGAASVIKSTVSVNPDQEIRPVVKEPYQPPFDPALPIENKIIIPTIGVNSDLNEATLDNFEEALKKGIWRVGDFGTPADRAKPTILAAHRFGYIAWSNAFRRANSFFNLPKLRPGDRIEIDWKQRKYVYEVYKEETGEQITDYSADLILYTCELLNSPTRIFRYARLLEQ